MPGYRMTNAFESSYSTPRRPNRSAMLIADDPVLVARATDALSIAGGSIVAQLGWDAGAAAIAGHDGVDTILVEAEGVSSERLAALLPAIEAQAHACGAVLVVALTAEQIDIVAAHMLGEHVQLLCDPTVAERVAALLVVQPDSGIGSVVSDKASEAESERLRRLNEEVARIAETLARLTRRDQDGAPPARRAGLVGDRSLGYVSAPATMADDAPIAASEVRRAIRARRVRDQFFAGGLLEDPAWDMLLDLVAVDLEQARVSVSSLCIAAAVAPTTALRWISKLTQAGLLERQPDPFDRRRAYMALSATARDAMTGYVAAIRRAGLSIG